MAKVYVRKGEILKKILVIVLIVGLGAYVSWDVSIKIVKKLRKQGSDNAIMEIITIAESERCEPFSVYAGEKIVNLINIDCLQEISDEETSDEGMSIEKFDSSNTSKTKQENND